MAGPVSDSRPTPTEQKTETLTCVFCGHAYPDGTPPSKHRRLVEHIRNCPKHLMRKWVKRAHRAEERFNLLFSSLSGIAQDIRLQHCDVHPPEVGPYACAACIARNKIADQIDDLADSI